MKKIIKNITVILLAAILLINSSGVNVFAKNYSFSGSPSCASARRAV